MPATLNVVFGSEELILLADRALYWPRRKTLLLADVHLGKDASFRAAGLPVPAGNSAKDLARITSLVHQTGADRLIILGDLVHGRSSHQPELSEAVRRWRSAHQHLDVLLVRGNHDRGAGPVPLDWQIEQTTDPYDDENQFVLAHLPVESEKPLLCGHVHPVVAVADFDGSFVRMPCFVIDAKQMILPAFGSFTGGHVMQRADGRTIFASPGKSVFRLP